MRDVFIVDAVRTPRGRGKAGKGGLSSVHPQELLAQTLNHLARKSGIRTEDVEDVVVGCVTQASEQGACIARPAILAAGWPETVTGTTVNRFCGSGAQAVNFAAMGVMSGQQELAIGGGVESMSRVPIGACGPLDIVPRGTVVIRPGTVHVTVGKPISTDGWTLATLNRHVAECHDAVEQNIQASSRRREARLAGSRSTDQDVPTTS